MAFSKSRIILNYGLSPPKELLSIIDHTGSQYDSKIN